MNVVNQAVFEKVFRIVAKSNCDNSGSVLLTMSDEAILQ